MQIAYKDPIHHKGDQDRQEYKETKSAHVVSFISAEKPFLYTVRLLGSVKLPDVCLPAHALARASAISDRNLMVLARASA